MAEVGSEALSLKSSSKNIARIHRHLSGFNNDRGKLHHQRCTRDQTYPCRSSNQAIQRGEQRHPPPPRYGPSRLLVTLPISISCAALVMTSLTYTAFLLNMALQARDFVCTKSEPVGHVAIEPQEDC